MNHRRIVCWLLYSIFGCAVVIFADCRPHLLAQNVQAASHLDNVTLESSSVKGPFPSESTSGNALAKAVARSENRTLATSDSDSLPDAPQHNAAIQSATVQTLQADGSATISGVVQDVSEASVSGAEVILTNEAGSQRRTTTSGNTGEFVFTQVPAGSYFMLINVSGLAVQIVGDHRHGPAGLRDAEDFASGCVNNH
jgi:hypothetical protein